MSMAFIGNVFIYYKLCDIKNVQVGRERGQVHCKYEYEKYERGTGGKTLLK